MLAKGKERFAAGFAAKKKVGAAASCGRDKA